MRGADSGALNTRAVASRHSNSGAYLPKAIVRLEVIVIIVLAGDARERKCLTSHGGSRATPVIFRHSHFGDVSSDAFEENSKSDFQEPGCSTRRQKTHLAFE